LDHQQRCDRALNTASGGLADRRRDRDRGGRMVGSWRAARRLDIPPDTEGGFPLRSEREGLPRRGTVRHQRRALRPDRPGPEGPWPCRPGAPAV